MVESIEEFAGQPEWKVRQIQATDRGHLQWATEEIMKGLTNVAKILKEVHDRKSWRHDFPTFEAYCEKEFKISRGRAYQIISGEGVRVMLAESKDPVVQEAAREISEVAARELAVLPPAKREKVVKRLMATGKVTAPRIREVTKPRGEVETCPTCGQPTKRLIQPGNNGNKTGGEPK